MWPWISSVVMFRCSFLILLILAISFFLLVKWAKGLSALFNFSKNQLLIFVCIVFFISILLHSALNFNIFCHLLDLGFVCSCFSQFLGCAIKPFICTLSNFVR